MSEVESLDLGVDRPTGRHRRLWRVLLTAAVVVAGSAFVVDRVLRDREADQIATCADRVSAAVELEGRQVRATYEYVRYAAGLVNVQGQLEDLYLLIAQAARRSGGELLTARDTCTSIAVSPFHNDLRNRRDTCVDVLDAQRSRLAAVAEDGRSGTLRKWLDAPQIC